MFTVTLIGGAAPFREAVGAALARTDGLSVDDGLVDTSAEIEVPDGSDSAAVDRRLIAIYCDREERWIELEALAADESAMTLAILTELDVAEYARALSVGADGVVHADSSSSIIANVARAATTGEIVLPSFVARSLAATAQNRSVPTTLTDHEQALLAQLCDGARVADLADRFSYSERTIRRQLQNLYLKVQVTSRAQAISYAVRNGIC